MSHREFGSISCMLVLILVVGSLAVPGTRQMRIRSATASLCAVTTVEPIRHHNAGLLESKAKLRRPVALGLVDDEKTLLAVNERSGTLSGIRVDDSSILFEQPIGVRPTDLTVLDNGRTIAVVDFESHELTTWGYANERLVELDRVSVSAYPTKVVATSDEQTLIVSSLWSRRLTIVERQSDNHGKLSMARQIDFDFAPRELLLLSDDRHLFVADAFGGKLAIVDLTTMEILRTVEVPGHNIRGLATTPDEKMLLVSHQMLNELAHTVRNDVHWGLLMSNDLRWLKIEALLAEDGNLFEGAHMHPLGQAGNAAGDPTGVTVTQSGDVIVALGGVSEVAIGREEDFSLDRIGVGKRPTEVIASKDGAIAFIANTFSDSISVVNVGDKQVVREIPLGEMPELTLAERGELLFHDARFSHDKWMSCQSCHTDGHTNGMLNDNFTDQSFGAPKRVLSLLGKADTLPLAWDGSVKNFHDQVEFSIKSTMQSDFEPDEGSVEALAAFLMTLPPPPALDVARGVVDRDVVASGAEVFESLRCATCHEPPLYTTPDTYDVGINDEMGHTHFNPPSLRGVSQRVAYFHDNRAKTLSEVFSQYKHRLTRELSDEELRALVAYLRTL